MPRNELKKISCDLYEEKSQKYQGREFVSGKAVEPLGCRWGDVVFLSPVHPSLIRAELSKYKETNEKQFFVIPINSLNSEDLAMFWYDNSNESHYDDVSVLREIDLGGLSDITKRHYERSFAQGKHPLLFHGLPHVLYRGKIDVSDLEVINW